MRHRYSLALGVAALLAAMPVQAQIFWQSPDFRGGPLIPGEAGIGVTLPGATVAEERANWVWQMRAALNLASLQCKFDKTLLASDLYSGVLRNHGGELSAAYETLRGYFKRTSAAPRAAQDAIDKYGTRTYSGYSTVGSQLGYCDAAARIGRRALMAARGSFTIFVVENLRELRNALVLSGEQQFRFGGPLRLTTPSLDSRCWNGRGYRSDRCPLIDG